MAGHGLDPIFKPKRIAVFGANQNPKGVGSTVLRNLVNGGFRGVVYPVNPQCEAVLGIHCFPGMAGLPRVPDLAVVCSPAYQVPGIVRSCGEAGVLGLVIISAGFREAGKAGRDLEEQVRQEASRHDGMRIVGPNCLGIIVPGLQLNASFAADMPEAGKVAFISQSGALCTSVLDWALEEKIGFSHFVSVGNALDVDFGDLIDYFGETEEAESIILYMESVRDARRFLSAARAFARTKPIVAYKAGRFAESAKAAGSHTGALAGEDAVYEAAFQRAGIARVFEIGDIFDCAEMLARHRPPAGARLGIVTNAGGPGVMATDALIANGGELATLSDETIEILGERLPPFWSGGNPVDVLGDARSKRYAKALEVVLADRGIDAALVILSPQAMTRPTSTAKAVGTLAQTTRKPVLAAWLGSRSVREGIRVLNEMGVSTYATPEQAVRAFMTLVAYARNLETLHETPRDIPVHFTLDRDRLREIFPSLLPTDTDVLPESESKRILAAYGIPVTETHPARSEEEAVAAAERVGYPVVAKVLSDDITHKTDVGGVALDLEDSEAVRRAYRRIIDAAREAAPKARVDGVTIQRMVRSGHGFELIVGAKRDPTFGAVVMVGMGGVAAEVLRDRCLGFPPLNERLARRMLESLRAWPLLRGYRGRPGLALDRVIEILMRFSYLVADYPEIVEIDINPLLGTEDDAVALDARILIDRMAIGKPHKPYAHLALRPYPGEYVTRTRMPDGTEVIFRPIRPEDEPMWRELLGSCSAESLYARFGYLTRFATHEIATRYCFNDYDRELAIVAEVEEDDGRRLAGVGRLVADPAHRTAEYAVLLGDDWQNRGFGRMLTDYCIGVARDWGLERVYAQTTTQNPRMIAIFRERGFRVKVDEHAGVVDVDLTLAAGP